MLPEQVVESIKSDTYGCNGILNHLVLLLIQYEVTISFFRFWRLLIHSEALHGIAGSFVAILAHHHHGRLSPTSSDCIILVVATLVPSRREVHATASVNFV